MDRRQQKTRAAIFKAFIELISEENYHKITIQEIIDKANIGRSTFYSHFETKDDLLDAICEEVFHHILDSATDLNHTHGVVEHEGKPNSVICHILQHIKENDHNILTLLSCEGNDFFISSFKNHLTKLMELAFFSDGAQEQSNKLPRDFVINHITGSFINMVPWWIDGGLKQSPQELDAMFSEVITRGF